MACKAFPFLPAAVLALFVTVGGVQADPGELNVYDDGQAFTSEAIQKAKDKFAGESFPAPTVLTFRTLPDVPEDRLDEFDKVKNDPNEKGRFFFELTKSYAEQDGKNGIYVLITMGRGSNVTVIVDGQTDIIRNFGDTKSRELRAILVDEFGKSRNKSDEEAKETRDVGLMNAVDYVSKEMKTGPLARTTGRQPVDRVAGDNAGANLGGYLCMGILILMGVWFVFGLFRAMSGGGAGGGGSGGGGGFMTSMLGGLFGAAAGMYLYNQFMGGDSLSAGESDGFGNDGNFGDDGAGDWDRGNYSGGDYDGGGDWGGGDFGGGDFGGGDW